MVTRLPLLVLARDWLGAQRALGRFVRSLIGAVAAATLLVLGAGPGSIGAAAAALVLFGATASWVEGLAAHADHAASGVVPGTPGRLFTLRRDVNLVSNVLDIPELFWDEASLKALYDAVREYMEIGPRVQVLNEKIAVAEDLVRPQELNRIECWARAHGNVEWLR